MNADNFYGLNKEARLRAEREKDYTKKEVPLNPAFPFEVLAFHPETFGITHYSDAEPDKAGKQV